MRGGLAVRIFSGKKKLRKEVDSDCFLWGCFVVFVLYTDNYPESTLHASAAVHILGFSYLCIKDKIQQPGQDNNGPGASVALSTEVLSLFC